MKLAQKTAVVTGVGAGIGKALAVALANECKGLALCDIDGDKLAETVAACKKQGVKVHAVAFDVADQGAMEAFAESSLQELGEIDLVINNAGVALGTHSIDELTYKDFEWVFGINLWGMIYGSNTFLPHLVTRPEAALVNVSSVFGLMGVAQQIPYCTTKFAIRGFTESLRMEAILKYPNLNVISVHPGGIDTDIVKNSRWTTELSPQQREAAVKDFKNITRSSPAKAAEVILKGIRKNKNRILIGNDARLISFLTRFLPSAYVPIVSKFLRRKMRQTGRLL